MKRLFAAFSIFIIPFCVYAEPAIGIKGGTEIVSGGAYTAFTAENPEPAESSEGTRLGIFFYYPFNKSLALYTEVNFATDRFGRRARYTVRDEDTGEEYETTSLSHVMLSYIEIPVLLQYNLGGPFDSLDCFLEGGVSARFLTGRFPYYSRYYSDADLDLRDAPFKIFVLRAHAGLGFIVDFAMSGSKKNFVFTGEIRCGYDATPVINDARFLKSDISIGIGYKLK